MLLPSWPLAVPTLLPWFRPRVGCLSPFPIAPTVRRDRDRRRRGVRSGRPSARSNPRSTVKVQARRAPVVRVTGAATGMRLGLVFRNLPHPEFASIPSLNRIRRKELRGTAPKRATSFSQPTLGFLESTRRIPGLPLCILPANAGRSSMFRLSRTSKHTRPGTALFGMSRSAVAARGSTAMDCAGAMPGSIITR